MPKVPNGEKSMSNNKPKLTVNHEKAKLLGVCAGIADFVGIEVWMVRAAYIASLFFAGWFMIPVYFIAWFFMDDQKSRNGEARQETLKARSKGKIARQIDHFRNVDYRKKLYKNPKERKFLGVCAGIADYLEVDVTVVRIIVVLTSLIPGSFVPLAYFIAYFILDKKPENVPDNNSDSPYSKVRETLDDPKHFSRSTFKSCSRKYSALHGRLTRLEAYVTSSRFKLDREFKNI